MSDTLLVIIQEFADRRGLDRPGAVMSSQDDTIRQLRSLINEVVSDVVGRGAAWPKLSKQATFVTVGTEIQADMDTIAPYGFKRVLPDSLYNRTTRVALFGPRGPAAWQASEAIAQVGPYYSYRIWQGSFWLQPAPAVGETIAFEYESDYAILGSASATDFKKRFSADDDLFLLNSDILFLGLNAKYRREKGLSYAQEKEDYEAFLTQELGNQADKGEVNMAGGCKTARPGFIVPSGNWPL